MKRRQPPDRFMQQEGHQAVIFHATDEEAQAIGRSADRQGFSASQWMTKCNHYFLDIIDYMREDQTLRLVLFSQHAGLEQGISGPLLNLLHQHVSGPRELVVILPNRKVQQMQQWSDYTLDDLIYSAIEFAWMLETTPYDTLAITAEGQDLPVFLSPIARL